MKRLAISLFLGFFIICTLISQDADTPSSMKSVLKKNSIYIENMVILPSINYDRIIPLSNKTGIALKAGLSYYSEVFLITEASILVGGIKHYFEIGSGWGGKDNLGLFGRLGYRYIGAKGLMLKGGVIIVKNVPIFPAIGIGIAF